MKTRHSLSNWFLTCGFALVAVVATQSLQAQEVKDGKATVKFVSGTVKYAGADGAWVELKPGMELSTGASIQTAEGADSYADLSLNDRTAMVRVAPATTVKVEKMTTIAGGVDTETLLNLKEGTVLGSVKKLSKASHFDVKVSNGVAGIRGTDFSVTVKKLANGMFEVTFACVKGEVVATAIVPGKIDPVTTVLHDKDQWTPGTQVVKVSRTQIEAVITLITTLIKNVENPNQPGPVTPGTTPGDEGGDKGGENGGGTIVPPPPIPVTDPTTIPVSPIK